MWKDPLAREFSAEAVKELMMMMMMTRWEREEDEILEKRKEREGRVERMKVGEGNRLLVCRGLFSFDGEEAAGQLLSVCPVVAARRRGGGGSPLQAE